jgi:hypothetical protein
MLTLFLKPHASTSPDVYATEAWLIFAMLKVRNWQRPELS